MNTDSSLRSMINLNKIKTNTRTKNCFTNVKSKVEIRPSTQFSSMVLKTKLKRLPRLWNRPLNKETQFSKLLKTISSFIKDTWPICQVSWEETLKFLYRASLQQICWYWNLHTYSDIILFAKTCSISTSNLLNCTLIRKNVPILQRSTSSAQGKKFIIVRNSWSIFHKN